jgi:hypothetical protein
MIHLIIWLLVVAILFSLAWYVITQIPLPAQIQKILTVVLVVIACLIVVGVLLNFAGIALPN